MSSPSILRRACAIMAAALIALTAAACGSGDEETTRSTAASTPSATVTPTATPSEADAHAEEDEHAEEGEHRFEPGHSRAVRRYYGDAHEAHEGDDLASIEAEYHQPPKPAAGRLGDPITLTGVNIGVRLQVTPTRLIDPARARRPATGDRRWVAVELRLENTGIAVFESELRSAAVTDDRGRRAPAAVGVRSDCSNGFHKWMRLDVGLKARGCVLFELPASRTPEVLQLALESVPVAAGGRWDLR